jgi:hypothetical protein
MVVGRLECDGCVRNIGSRCKLFILQAGGSGVTCQLQSMCQILPGLATKCCYNGRRKGGQQGG